MPRLEPDPPPATRKPPATRAPAASATTNPKQSSTQLGRVPTAGRPAIRPGQSMTTGALSSLDTGTTAGSFGHGVMAEQTKKGGAALTWLLVILGLGGLGYIAYTVFTMK